MERARRSKKEQERARRSKKNQERATEQERYIFFVSINIKTSIEVLVLFSEVWLEDKSFFYKRQDDNEAARRNNGSSFTTSGRCLSAGLLAHRRERIKS